MAPQHQHLIPDTEATWTAVIGVMREVTPVIRGTLARAGMAGDVDDVAQETVLSAVTGIQKWDAAGGPLVAWVTTIGKRRAIDHIRRQTTHGASVVTVAGHGGDEETPSVDVVAESHEDGVIERADAWEQIRSVLGEVRLVLRNDRTVHRALTLLIECDGNVQLAARTLGVAEPVMREARRETIRMAIVVRNAIALHETGGPVTLRHLLDCLPAEIGAWTRVIAVEAAKAGGFDAVKPEVMAVATGWSASTARQRLNDTAWLLSIARSFAEEGSFSAKAA